LPREIVYRSKHGFGVPIAKWFQKNDMDWNHELSLPLMNSLFFEKKRTEHIQKKHDHRLFLWNYWLLGKYAMSLPINLDEG